MVVIKKNLIWSQKLSGHRNSSFSYLLLLLASKRESYLPICMGLTRGVIPYTLSCYDIIPFLIKIAPNWSYEGVKMLWWPSLYFYSSYLKDMEKCKIKDKKWLYGCKYVTSVSHYLPITYFGALEFILLFTLYD